MDRASGQLALRNGVMRRYDNGMYNKLFGKIVRSSIWLSPDPHRLVWITLLATMDEDGFADFACIETLAHTARVSIDDCRAAVEVFEGPDPQSGNPDNDGRRIERVPGGWIVLNAPIYRAIVTREEGKRLGRERAARWRAKHGAKSNAGVTVRNDSVTGRNDRVTQSYTEAEADQKHQDTTAALRPAQCQEFIAFKSIYPSRAGSQPWRRAEKAANARLAEGHTWLEMHEGARRYAEFCRVTGKLNTEIVQQAATFLGPSKPFLETWTPPATKAETRLAGNLDAAAEFMRRTDHAAE